MRIRPSYHVRFLWPAILFCAAAIVIAQPAKEISSQPGQTSVAQANLPAGVYEITFRLQVDRREDSVTHLAALTVNVPEYPDVIYRMVTPVNFDSAGASHDFRFILDNFKTQDVRAAIVPASNTVPVPKLTVERITIAQVAGPVIGRVWPGKVLYRTGEDAEGFVVVYNGSEKPRTVTLRCVLESDVNRVRPLKDEQLTLAAGERREIPLTWNTGQEEYGFALTATLLNDTGGELGQNREYFSVADNLWKVAVREAGRGNWAPYGPSPNEALPVNRIQEWENQLATEMAKPFVPGYWNYSNYAEYSFGSPDSFFVQAPKQDYWYTGMGNYTMGKRWIQMSAEWLHRRGMRAVNYILPGSCGYGGDEIYRKHPEWFIYEKDGRLGVGAYNEKLLEVGSQAPGGAGTENLWEITKLGGNALSLHVNLAGLEPIDAFIDQVVKSREMFGWDGIRFDVAPFLTLGYDFHGNKIDDNDPKKKSELEVRAWTYMRDTLRQKLGTGFVVGINSDRDLYYDQYPELWDELCRKGQLLMEEVPRSCYSPQSARNRWYDYMIFYRGHGEIVRGLGGHHLMLGFDKQYPVDHLYLNFLLYAMRTHSFSGCNSDTLPLGKYGQFVTRYSALIWDIDTVKTLSDPEKAVTVGSALPVWWKELACVRQTPDGKRQYIIHLVNPPVQERIYTDPTNKVPAPIDDIQVTLKPAAGEKITRAYLLSADPATRQELLPVRIGTGQVSVTVPRLYFWSIVVLEGGAR